MSRLGSQVGFQISINTSILGCDLTTGTCKKQPDELVESEALSAGMKVILGVVAVVTLLVILPALYAMYNMRIEHRQRNARIRSQLELDRMTQQTYLGEQNRITSLNNAFVCRYQAVKLPTLSYVCIF